MIVIMSFAINIIPPSYLYQNQLCFRSMNMTEEGSGLEVGGSLGGGSLAADWPGDDLDLLIVIATSLILILMILTTIVGRLLFPLSLL